MKYTARKLKTNVNVTPTSPLREFFVLTGALGVIAIGTYFLLGLAVDLLVPYLPLTVEDKLARVFFNALDDKEADAGHQRYVQNLVDDLEARCTDLPYEFQVHVFQSSTVNALALPGGHIIIFTGLLDKVASENELAFVLAHELGHYAHRDHLRGIGRTMIFLTISTVLFGADSGISDLIGTGLNITELSFSRKQETWADEFALDALNCSYGHVGGATDFFGRIPAEQDPGDFGHYFSSHPQNTRRIDRLNQLAAAHRYEFLSKKPLAADLKLQKN